MTDPRFSGEKTCSKCKVPLPVIYFAGDSSHADGLASRCHGCDQLERDGKKRKGSGLRGLGIPGGWGGAY